MQLSRVVGHGEVARPACPYQLLICSMLFSRVRWVPRGVNSLTLAIAVCRALCDIAIVSPTMVSPKNFTRSERATWLFSWFINNFNLFSMDSR